MFSLDFPKKRPFCQQPGGHGGSLGAPELPLQAPQKARRTLPGRAIAQGFGLAEVSRINMMEMSTKTHHENGKMIWTSNIF